MKRDLKSIIGSRLATFVVVGIAIYITANTVGVIARNWQLQREIATLNGEIEVLKAENERLSYDIEYYKTDQYLEQAARQKLDLKAPGETVTIVGNVNQTVDQGKNLANISQPEAQKSNWRAWLDFLLGRK